MSPPSQPDACQRRLWKLKKRSISVKKLTSRAIAKLLEEGKKVSEIAEELDMTDKNVQAYMPYSRGEYGKPDKTNAAINIANYRKRNSNIAAKTQEKKDSSCIDSAALLTKYSKKRIMKLHLELELDEQCLPTLRKYGKVKNGISRDILAPSDMTLLALHYVIQRAFGWQEWHLHTFEIDNNVLDIQLLRLSCLSCSAPF